MIRHFALCTLFGISASIAQTYQLDCPSPCQKCPALPDTCEETTARLLALEAAVAGLGVCPPPVESAPADTGGSPVTEEVQSRLGSHYGNLVLDVAASVPGGTPIRAKSWSSRHPVASAFIWGFAGAVIYAVIENQDDDVDVDSGQRGKTGAPGEPGVCWPPGHCK